MVNPELLVEEYTNRFPKISRRDHEVIVNGALGGDRPVMSQKGFRSWYDSVGLELDKYPDILAEIRANPHGVMHREVMILGGDWVSTPIMDKVHLQVFCKFDILNN